MPQNSTANPNANADIKNIVVVRFSLRLNEEWQKKAYGDEGNRSRWFNYRMILFNDFLAKSLRSQRVKSLVNFVLMDQVDQENYQKYENDFSDIVTPIFSKNHNHYCQVSEEIKRLGFQNIALSRIDSDDAVADDYFYELNKTINSSLENGLMFSYVVATRGYRAGSNMYQELFYNCSPFLTRYVKSFNGENIYELNHEHVVQHQHIQCSSARWIQVIHDKNIGNNFIDSRFDEKSFLEEVDSNPKIVSTMPLVYANKIAPQILTPYLNSLKYRLTA
jgi:hypothetical protein